MSVKFEKETVKTTAASVKDSKHHEGLVHDVGEALTRGGGANGYLQVRISLARRIHR